MRHFRLISAVVAASLSIAAFICAPSQASPADPTVIAVGDIARYVNGPQGGTAQLATALHPQYALLLGDLAYTAGSNREFSTKFAPSWGQAIGPHHIATIAVPGNHEYGTPNAAGYRAAAATYHFPETGNDLWSVTRVGSWTVIGLDSEQLGATHLTSKGKRQITFLKTQLQANNGRPTIVMWHRPRYSTGQHGNQTDIGVKSLWSTATADPDVKLVLWGHDHDFEPGIRTIASKNGVASHKVLAMTIGTGGAEPYVCNHTTCLTGSYGVVKFTLHTRSVNWEFHAVATGHATGTVLKSGSLTW